MAYFLIAPFGLASGIQAQPDLQVPPGSLILAGPKNVDCEQRGLTSEQRAMIRKAAQAFKSEGAKAQSDYLAASDQLPHCPLLNMEHIASKDDLLFREGKVKNCLLANERFKNYIDHWEEHYTDIVKSNVPDESLRKSLIELYPAMYGKFQADALAVRKAEMKRIDTYVRALKLLVDNWGQWTWKTNGPSSTIAANPALTAQINAFVHQVNALRHEEQEAHETALRDFQRVNASVAAGKK